jgi:hypothetical protein
LPYGTLSRPEEKELELSKKFSLSFTEG